MMHISLFSGIGGFDLVSEWMGWKNIASCEINEFGNKVLEYYWPEAYHHRDIHTLTYDTINIELSKRFGTRWRNDDIILTGGFPCQPYSAAGKRLGKEDERHLWPEMLRVIREVAPRYIVGENVLGIVNWNGGLVFDEVQADLEDEGYEVATVVIPAAAVNAPHGRDRVWFVARRVDAWNADNNQRAEVEGVLQGSDAESNGVCTIAQNTMHSGCTQRKPEQEGTGIWQQRDIGAGDTERVCGAEMAGLTADTEGTGSKRQRKYKSRKVQFNGRNSGTIRTDWQNFPTQPPICGGDDGLPTRLDGIAFSKWRNESIKAYGNAIVPQVAFEIFKVILSIETQP